MPIVHEVVDTYYTYVIYTMQYTLNRVPSVVSHGDMRKDRLKTLDCFGVMEQVVAYSPLDVNRKSEKIKQCMHLIIL